jgi:hypothetical protein
MTLHASQWQVAVLNDLNGTVELRSSDDSPRTVVYDGLVTMPAATTKTGTARQCEKVDCGCGDTHDVHTGASTTFALDYTHARRTYEATEQLHAETHSQHRNAEPQHVLQEYDGVTRGWLAPGQTLIASGQNGRKQWGERGLQAVGFGAATGGRFTYFHLPTAVCQQVYSLCVVPLFEKGVAIRCVADYTQQTTCGQGGPETPEELTSLAEPWTVVVQQEDDAKFLDRRRNHTLNPTLGTSLHSPEKFF